MFFALALFGMANQVDPQVPLSYADQSVPARYAGRLVLNKPVGFSEKVIALTFDDGPDPANTSQIVNAFARNGSGKATFFVMGMYTANHQDIVKWTADQGHVIANHTWAHPATPSQVRAKAELDRTDWAIYNATGRRPTLFRPPYGIRTSWTSRLAMQRGMPSVLWNRLGPDSVRHPSESVIVNTVLSQASPGDIVLFHDGPGKHATANAIDRILPALVQRGYSFITVPDMLRRWDRFLTEQAAQKAAKRKTPAPKAPSKN
jgi:peptidoglycan-N-acetylglucosamine deacetylase